MIEGEVAHVRRFPGAWNFYLPRSSRTTVEIVKYAPKGRIMQVQTKCLQYERKVEMSKLARINGTGGRGHSRCRDVAG